jgi:hypothetical protein
MDTETHIAVATMTDGTSEQPITAQEIPWTHFPLPGVTLWLVEERDHWVVLLSSEY